jgi:DHA2 family multidrug resistance protein-like MFS transporter
VQIGVLALATAAATVFLIRRERRQEAPVLPLDLMRIPTFAMAIATSICTFMAMTTAIFALPFFLQVQLGQSKVMTGVLMTPWPLCAGLCAPLSGRLADRYSAGILSSIGLGVLALGLTSLALLPAAPAAWTVAASCAVCGAGVGIFQSPNNRAMITSAPLHRGGGASGMVGVARGLGQAFGGVLAAIVFGHATVWGYNAAFAVAAAVAGLAALVSLSRLKVIKD